MAGIGKAVVCVLVAWPAIAQSQTSEKIIIKPAFSADPRSKRLQVLPNGDLKARAVSVNTLLSYAYDVPVNPSPRLFSLPDWTSSERYDIDENAHKATTALSQDSEAQNQAKQMIRRLLADRFQLVMRVERKRMPVYALSVSSSGPKLQRSTMQREKLHL